MDQSTSESFVNAGLQQSYYYKQLGLDDEHRPRYIIIGSQLPKEQDKKILIIKHLNVLFLTNQPFRGYFFIFVYSKVSNDNECYQFFKLLFKTTPELQLKRLVQLFIVQPSMSFKSHIFFTFGKELSFFKQKIQYIKKIEQLLSLVKFPKYAEDILLGFSKKTNTPILNKPFIGRLLSEYPATDEHVPSFLEEFIDYFDTHFEFLKSEGKSLKKQYAIILGVFRISGSVIQEQKLLNQLQYNDYTNLYQYEPQVISTILKNVFVNLSEPIFPYKIYDKVKQYPESIQRESLLENITGLIDLLPELNKNTIKYMITFLFIVSRFEQTNKMGANNLGIVFAPCFFRPKNMQADDMIRMKTLIKHFSTMISNAPQLFGHQSADIDNIDQCNLHILLLSATGYGYGQKKQKELVVANNTFSEALSNQIKEKTKKKWYELFD